MTKHLREANHFLGDQTRCLEPSDYSPIFILQGTFGLCHRFGYLWLSPG